MIPLGWGDAEVPLHSYVAFYYTTDEAVLRSLAFLRAGLDEPDTFCMLLAERERIEGFLAQLQEGCAGDVAECVERGKLVAAPWHPNFDGLADALMGRIEAALADGYVRVRAMGLVAWAAVGWGDAAWLKRCESRINLATSMYPMVILCTYSLPDLPGLAVTGLDGGEHPQVVVNEAMGALTASMAKAAMSVSRRLGRRRLPA